MSNQLLIRSNHSGHLLPGTSLSKNTARTNIPSVKAVAPVVSHTDSSSFRAKEKQSKEVFAQDIIHPKSPLSFSQSHADSWKYFAETKDQHKSSFYRQKEFTDLSKNSQRALSLYESFTKADVNHPIVGHLNVIV